MQNFLVGMIGALGPEIVRWRRITRGEAPEESLQPGYVLATIAYVLLAGFMATLVAQSNPYAAFITGVTAEYAIAGMLSAPEKSGPEELGIESATRIDWALSTMWQHAAYLTQNG